MSQSSRTRGYMDLCIKIMEFLDKNGFPENLNPNDKTKHLTVEIGGYVIDVRPVNTAKNLRTFNMHGYESINDVDIDGQKHKHKDGDACHRCGSTNTDVTSDSNDQVYWIFLQCNNCKLCCIFAGGRED